MRKKYKCLFHNSISGEKKSGHGTTGISKKSEQRNCKCVTFTTLSHEPGRKIVTQLVKIFVEKKQGVVEVGKKISV